LRCNENKKKNKEILSPPSGGGLPADIRDINAAAEIFY
jgi:hypothetical protein